MKLLDWLHKAFRSGARDAASVESLTIELHKPKQEAIAEKPKKDTSEIEIVEATHSIVTHDNKNRKHPEHQAYDDDLIAQYCKLRKEYNPDFPEEPTVPGDKQAGFLLAVHNGKVIGGFRLNEVSAGELAAERYQLYEEAMLAASKLSGKERRALEIRASELLNVQSDKIKESWSENLFPDIKRGNYTILNVDGAMFAKKAPSRLLLAATKQLLDGMVDLARRRGYDAVSFVPAIETKLDKRIIDHYTKHPHLREEKVPIVDYGEMRRKGKGKRVLCVVLDPQLKNLLPSNVTRHAYR